MGKEDLSKKSNSHPPKLCPESRISDVFDGRKYWLLRIAFDAAGAVAHYVANQHTWGVIFALVAALNCILGYVWKQ